MSDLTANDSPYAGSNSSHEGDFSLFRVFCSNLWPVVVVTVCEFAAGSPDLEKGA